MSAPRKKHFLVSAIGALFYFTATIGILWSFLPFLPSFVKLSTSFQSPIEPKEAAAYTATTVPPSLLLIGIVVVITVAVLGAMFYVLAKLPSTINKIGKTVTKKTSDLVVPLVAHHAPLSTKKRRQLTTRVIVYIKLALVIIPMIATGLSFLVPLSLDYEITVVVGAVVAITALLLLSIQQLLARLLKVTLDSF